MIIKEDLKQKLMKLTKCGPYEYEHEVMKSNYCEHDGGFLCEHRLQYICDQIEKYDNNNTLLK